MGPQRRTGTSHYWEGTGIMILSLSFSNFVFQTSVPMVDLSKAYAGNPVRDLYYSGLFSRALLTLLQSYRTCIGPDGLQYRWAPSANGVDVVVRTICHKIYDLSVTLNNCSYKTLIITPLLVCTPSARRASTLAWFTTSSISIRLEMAAQ